MRTPHQPSHCPEILEIEAQQDEIIRGIAAIEEELNAKQEDVVKSDSIDSSDKDYQPIPHMPPCAHDREAGGSS